MLPCRIIGTRVEPGEPTRFVLFVLGGGALGYFLHAAGRFRGSKAAMLSLMVVRLVIFVLVVGILSRRFGSLAGLGLILGAISTRALLLRRASEAPETRVGE
jgi:hypothetical protein